MDGVGPGQDGDTDGDAERRTQHERPQLSEVERAAQLPDRITLHDQAERDDQGCRLQGG